ncbi:hypothetical protein C7212DRAFT_357329 [Tuber magnatum]|uniref:Uncharacterized protein n=1 Tax=Tuber magnatum TaxID=42249 RepID=A0A317SPQ2_9PEZI|nr:hypothetical protein C7212DRAFT_357329 [Tuber magnatum]
MTLNLFNLNDEFFDWCLRMPAPQESQPPILPASTPGPLTAPTFKKPNGLNRGGVVTHSTPLINHYPAGYKDFFGMPSMARCIYKSGPAWPEPNGPEGQSYIREARPVYGHRIANKWLDIGTEIYTALDTLGVKWTSIDPVAFANAGEKMSFCPLLIWIGVKHETLTYQAAVTAANTVKDILFQAGFPNLEVAFRESEVIRSVGGPKLLPFHPLIDPIPEFRKAFTATLGLSIAPLRTPYYEGTGGLYFRLACHDDRVALPTAAHVARPALVFPNAGMSPKGNAQPREEIVALGSMAYQNATNALMATIGDLAHSVAVWRRDLAMLGEPIKGETPAVTEMRMEHKYEVEKATKTIGSLNKLHDEVTKRRTNPDQRVIGFVLHAEPIVISDAPHRFTCDWALVQLYNEKIDWATFPGNKVFIGGKLSPADFATFMFPQPEDQADYEYPENGLLQAFGVVKDHEIRHPQHLDQHCEKVLMVVKNGQTTGTTIGRPNGLESFTRIYSQYGMTGTSVEIAILSYDKEHGPFSGPGDSGSIILDRSGRIVALLTGGSGSTNGTDITYGTPYWWLEEQVKKAFPGSFLYEIVG